MTLEQVILDLTAARGPDKSICPTDAAREFAGENWRKVLGEVRKTAVRLAGEGRIEITRKGKPVDPAAFKGVYRLRAAIPKPLDPGLADGEPRMTERE